MQAKKIEVKEMEFNKHFICRMIPKLDWPALKSAADTVNQHTAISGGQAHSTVLQVGHGDGLPVELPEDYETNEELLKAAHHVLMEVSLVLGESVATLSCGVQVEVVEGELECPESGKKFPVEGGIPNMLLREEES